MNEYSELVGSFVRTAEYPLEANYIFETEEALRKFYKEELNEITLHKGLLKLVENDGEGKQALYWVIEKNEELVFEKLISANNIQELLEQLDNLESKLEQEIEQREKVDNDFVNAFNDFKSQIKSAYQGLLETDNKLREDLNATVGTEEDILEYLKTLPYQSLTEIANKLKETIGDPSKDFSSLSDIEEFVKKAISELKHTDNNLQTELNQTQQGVGLDGDGKFSPDQETNYLKNATSVMNALKILDGLINAANDSLKVSEKFGNQIIEDDGIYHSVDIDYKEGRLDFYVNGSFVKYYDLGLSGLVSDGRYDASTEEIIIELNVSGKEVPPLVIPVHSLIEEWKIQNNLESPVILNKERNIDGKDVLTADLKLSNNKYNILEKDSSGRLFVKGTADNIVFEGDLSIQEKVNQLEKEGTIQDDTIKDLQSKLDEETQRAKEAERSLQDNINDTNTALQQEIERAKDAEEDLQTELRYYTEKVDDIEVHPISKGFIEDPNELPSDPKEGDSYIYQMDDGTYWLYEYDGKNWQARVLQTGTLVSIANGDVYKLNSDGPEHLLDESDLDTINNTIEAEATRAKSAESTLQSNINTTNTNLSNHINNNTVHITADERSTWNAKQNAISDLDTIRSNASTAYGWGNHANVGYQTIVYEYIPNSTTEQNTTTVGNLISGNGYENFRFYDTKFYGNRTNTSTRCQVSYPYHTTSGDQHIKFRNYFDGQWNSWKTLANLSDLEGYSKTDTKTSGTIWGQPLNANTSNNITGSMSFNQNATIGSSEDASVRPKEIFARERITVSSANNSSSDKDYVKLQGGQILINRPDTNNPEIRMYNTTDDGQAHRWVVGISSSNLNTFVINDEGNSTESKIRLNQPTTVSGTLTASKIVKSDGQPNQYLMADGSVSTGSPSSGGSVSVSSDNNRASWNSSVTVGIVNETELKFTMPSNPNTDTTKTTEMTIGDDSSEFGGAMENVLEAAQFSSDTKLYNWIKNAARAFNYIYGTNIPLYTIGVNEQEYEGLFCYPNDGQFIYEALSNGRTNLFISNSRKTLSIINSDFANDKWNIMYIDIVNSKTYLIQVSGSGNTITSKSHKQINLND